MYKPKGFIDEATQQLRIKEQKENIIFLDIYWVLYSSNLAPPYRSSNPHEIDDDIENHPAIVGKFSEESVKLLKSNLKVVQSFSPDGLTNLRNLCATNEAKIVITAPWFHITTLEQFKIIFALSGLSDFIFDVIEAASEKTQGEKIEDWLLAHVRVVNSFVILDHFTVDILPRFGERLVCCRHLFVGEVLYQQAVKALAKPMDYEKSKAKRCWDAIDGNAPKLTELSINAETITSLKLCFSWNTQTLLDNLFIALTNNTQIKRLSLNSLNNHIEPTELLTRVSTLLVNSKMPLEYLDLAENKLQDLTELLMAIDQKNLDIPHLCFNANPLNREGQKGLATWINNQLKPLLLDLDLSRSGSGECLLSWSVIDALTNNDKVSAHTREEVLPYSRGDQRISELRSAGRLVVDETRREASCGLLRV